MVTAEGNKLPSAPKLNSSEGYMEMRYASIPAVCGHAIEVPESVVVALSLPTYVDKMFKPKQWVSNGAESLSSFYADLERRRRRNYQS